VQMLMTTTTDVKRPFYEHLLHNGGGSQVPICRISRTASLIHMLLSKRFE
jgi:hypothetical protein